VAVEPISGSDCDEKLALIGVGSGIGHGNAEGFMVEFEVLIVERFSPD
jgi:hypothetical protein